MRIFPAAISGSASALVNHLPPRDRDIAMVFQNYALYQHMSVYDNLAFGLRNKKTSEGRDQGRDRSRRRHARPARSDERKPKQLSGGQQQRVALGRCIVRNPQVFLFDEPLSNLDAKLRAQMRIEIKRLHAAIPTTSVFVTHDQVEAMTLGDRVVIMRDGRVQQVGTPLAGLRQARQQIRRRFHRRAGDEFCRRHGARRCRRARRSRPQACG